MIAIKDMEEMPRCCIDCPFLKADTSRKFFCEQIMKYIDKNELESKHKDCPLVEIVTCKDCAVKQYDHSESEECGSEKYFCPKIAEYVDETPNFYCADAERRA